MWIIGLMLKFYTCKIYSSILVQWSFENFLPLVTLYQAIFLTISLSNFSFRVEGLNILCMHSWFFILCSRKTNKKVLPISVSSATSPILSYKGIKPLILMNTCTSHNTSSLVGIYVYHTGGGKKTLWLYKVYLFRLTKDLIFLCVNHWWYSP